MDGEPRLRPGHRLNSAPYLNALAAECGLATNYHNISHASLLNYNLRDLRARLPGRGAVQGRLQSLSILLGEGHQHLRPSAELASLRGVDADRLRRRELGQLCGPPQPARVLHPLAGCAHRDLPLTRLASDLADNSLPALFITPNVCHDTHDCTITTGDDWLAGQVTEILNSPAYRAGHTVLFITYDEGEGGTVHCATNQTAVDCHVPTVIVSPSTPAGRRSKQQDQPTKAAT